MAFIAAVAIGIVVAVGARWSYRPRPEYLDPELIPLPTLDLDRSPIGDESCDGVELIEGGS